VGRSKVNAHGNLSTPAKTCSTKSCGSWYKLQKASPEKVELKGETLKLKKEKHLGGGE